MYLILIITCCFTICGKFSMLKCSRQTQLIFGKSLFCFTWWVENTMTRLWQDHPFFSVLGRSKLFLYVAGTITHRLRQINILRFIFLCIIQITYWDLKKEFMLFSFSRREKFRAKKKRRRFSWLEVSLHIWCDLAALSWCFCRQRLNWLWKAQATASLIKMYC